MQPNSTLAPVPVNATIGNANPLGRVATSQPLQPLPGCAKSVYDLLKNNPNATTFLNLANKTGASSVFKCRKMFTILAFAALPVLGSSPLLHLCSDIKLCSCAGLLPSLMDLNATITVLVPTNKAFANLSQNVLNTSNIDTLRLVGISRFDMLLSAASCASPDCQRCNSLCRGLSAVHVWSTTRGFHLYHPLPQGLLYHIIPGQLRASDVTSSITRGPVLPEVRFRF